MRSRAERRSGLGVLHGIDRVTYALLMRESSSLVVLVRLLNRQELAPSDE
jgi:hypothetical protein